MVSCFCGKTFKHDKALEAHHAAKHPLVSPWTCRDCNRSFGSDAALLQHRSDTGHSFCRSCNISLQGFKLQREHEARHCDFCGVCFSSKKKQREHRRTSEERACGDCDREFCDEQSLRDHCDDEGHAVEFECCDCNKRFGSAAALEQHSHDTAHAGVSNMGSNLHCAECNRDFKTLKGIDDHRKSLAHHPITKLRCAAAGKGKKKACKAVFTSPSAMLQHLESGQCRSGMTRGKVNRMVLEADAARRLGSGDTGSLGNVIFARRQDAMPRGNIVEIDDSSSEFDGVLLTPTQSVFSDDSIDEKAETIPSLTRCPFCPDTKKPFKNPQDLQNHLDSPAHAPRIFHSAMVLPEELAKTSPYSNEAEEDITRFSTVSGLTHHIENRAMKNGEGGAMALVHAVERKLTGAGMGAKMLK